MSFTLCRLNLDLLIQYLFFNIKSDDFFCFVSIKYQIYLFSVIYFSKIR